MTVLIITSFLFGFMGSLHCVGMCGPIALSLSFNPAFRKQYIKMILLQTAGRISMYMILGTAAGLLGEQIQLGGLQRTVSILTGVAILLLIFLPKKLQLKIYSLSGMEWFNQQLKRFWYPLLESKASYASYIMGLLNGLLPCGLLYLALIASAASGSVLNAVLFMLIFGLATSPALLTIFVSGGYLKKKFQTINRQVISVIAVCMAMLFIIRGLALGIPYISPVYHGDKACCDAEVGVND